MIPREHYKRDGYWVFKEALSVKELWSESFLETIFQEGVERYVQFLSIQAKRIKFQKIFLERNIIEVLNALGVKKPALSAPPVLHVMSPRLRIPDGYYGTGAHQDWPSVQGSLDMIAVWIALTDARTGNFPLEVIPGSHLEGLRKGALKGSVLEIECDNKDFIPIECEAGDVVFMSGFLIHRTGAGDGFRAAISQRFDNAVEPTFVERGYPCAQKRIVSRELITPDFPSVEQVRNIFS